MPDTSEKEKTDKPKKQGKGKHKFKKFFNDFKQFATKGNIVDLAIAVVIGGAFGKIVTSLVNDVIMPLITLAVGGVAVTDWKWVFTEAVYDIEGNLVKAENALRYGNFLQTILDFFIIAFFVFLALRILMNLKLGIDRVEKSIKVANSNECKALIKQLRSEGKSRAEINKAVKQCEEEKAAARKAEAEAKKAQEAANKPPTSEQLLTDIRDLLKGISGAELKQPDADKAQIQE